MLRESKFVRKATSSAMAAVLAVGLMPLPAFADTYRAADIAPQAASADGLVICAGYAANEPAPEILGLSNPQYRNAGEAQTIAAIFGKSINESPDPYLANMLSGDSPSIIVGGRGNAANGQASPMNALNHYNDTGAQGDNARKVWNLKPDIILGTGSDSIPNNESTYYDNDARLVETALGLAANSYNPIGVTYDRTDLNHMVNTMYRLAIAAERTMADNPAKTTRYTSSPLEIAKAYERYVTGTKGYVLKQINNNRMEKRTVAVVYDYDSATQTAQIMKGQEQQGTATQNRFLESVQGVADNYFDKLPGDGTQVTVSSNAGTQTYSLKTANLDDLKSGADLIILNSNASSGTSAECLAALSSANLLNKTFYVDNMNTGAIFGIAVNSVENAQNVGRILTCLYSDILDQSDFIAYYYDVFYHLNGSDMPATVAEMMDGVRNWAQTSTSDSAANAEWAEADVADYVRSEVDAITSEGIEYLRSLPASQLPDAILAPSAYYTMSSTDVTTEIEPDTSGISDLDSTDTGIDTEIADQDWAEEAISNTPMGKSLGAETSEVTLTSASDSATKHAWQEYINRSAEKVYGYDVDLYVLSESGVKLKQLTDSLKIEVTLPIDAQYNGKAAEVTQIHNGKEVAHPEVTKVENGAVKLEVTELSEFVVGIGDLSAPVYRMYNEGNGEHFYTTDKVEFDREIAKGGGLCHDEGIEWYAPTSGQMVNRYRNVNSDRHIYTWQPQNEAQPFLVADGGEWVYEGEAFCSADPSTGVEVYRTYSIPGAIHFYTASTSERNRIDSAEWGYYGYEGPGFYAVNTTRDRG